MEVATRSTEAGVSQLRRIRPRLARRLERLSLVVLSVVVLVVVLAPLAWIVVLSLKSPGNAFKTTALDLDPQAYIWLLTQTRFGTQYLNTVIVGASTSLITVGVSLLAAYGLSRYNPRGANLLMLGVAFTKMFPTVLLAIGLFVLWANIGLYNTLPGVILVHTVYTLPLALLIVRNYVDDIPKEIDEAALVDGCSRLSVLWQMIVPNARPGLLAAAAATFILSSHEFLLALTFIGSQDRKLLTAGIAELVGEWSTNYIALAAAGVLTSVPLAILFLVMQSYFVKGLTSGAVKE